MVQEIIHWWKLFSVQGRPIDFNAVGCKKLIVMISDATLQLTFKEINIC